MTPSLPPLFSNAIAFPPAADASCLSHGEGDVASKTPEGAVLMATAAAAAEDTVVLHGDSTAGGGGWHGDEKEDGEEDEEEEEEVDASKLYSIPQHSVADYGVDDRDANTPDKWVLRHPHLIRLTGKHPFNSEPPLGPLVDHGFITPVPLHYVRNHGYVPRLEWDTWRVEVTGLVKRPLSLSMPDLLAMPARELPVTLVCVGNRRKEQNMVKKSRGFNWGAAAVSTSVWKGVLLRDVLLRAGILPPRKGAKFVCFEGAETLPGGGGAGGSSSYGTSMPRSKALDVSQDVMLAYEQNGERLHPDHGFPVRMVIPGWIGGRMVKWVKKIVVSDVESQNYYHYLDNRVLPPSVDSERADAEGWWYRPEYICNELSINSAASAPAHDQLLLLSSPASHSSSFLFKGYAYSGGGRKVTRVEITLDDGATWRLCQLKHTERPTKHGKWWCWCFWELSVAVRELVEAKEVCVRAWDEATNTQPQHLTWNVLGMMNNCWFRIRIQPLLTPQGFALRFHHPTIPGPTPGGWMDKEAPLLPPPPPSDTSLPAPLHAVSPPLVPAAAAKAPAAAPGASAAAKASLPGLRSFSLSEVAQHSTAQSPWIIVRGLVYDCTRFVKEHPGGAESILINAGTDCTEEFDAIHSRKARAMLADYLIGEVGEEEGESLGVTPPASSPRPVTSVSIDVLPAALTGVVACALPHPPVALDPKRRVPFKLASKVELSRDVRRFRFALPSEDHVLGLPIGKHIFVCAKINGSLVMRAYTPTTCDNDRGFFDLVVKVYFKGEHPQFPDGGLMSQHLNGMEVGECVEVKGPIGHLHWLGRGHFTAHGSTHTAKRIAMLAGGTGLTPMYQIIKAVLRDPEDPTEMWLIYANRTAEDILLREELDKWAQGGEEGAPSRFHVWYTIESPGPPGWEFSTGRVNKEMMTAHLPPADADTVAFMCGPPGMVKFGCEPNLEALGYSKERMFVF